MFTHTANALGLVGVMAVTLAMSAGAAPQATVDHSAWDGLLWHFVEAGAVDYEGLQAERQTLEAYVADRLDEQLADQARQFLADPSRGLRIALDGNALWLSKIFKWYATDFVSTGPLDAEALLPVIAPYLDQAVARVLRAQPLPLKFLDYDWTLNIKK